ncbi:hypothetical protein NQ317_015742, partial [Molorchus minor]
ICKCEPVLFLPREYCNDPFNKERVTITTCSYNSGLSNRDTEVVAKSSANGTLWRTNLPRSSIGSFSTKTLNTFASNRRTTIGWHSMNIAQVVKDLTSSQKCMLLITLLERPSKPHVYFLRSVKMTQVRGFYSVQQTNTENKTEHFFLKLTIFIDALFADVQQTNMSIRRCMPKTYKNMDACTQLSNTINVGYGRVNKCLSCDTDLCNSGISLRQGIVTVLIFSISKLYLF